MKVNFRFVTKQRCQIQWLLFRVAEKSAQSIKLGTARFTQ